MSTRRTRAHPSPGGLRSLEDIPKRQRRKRKSAKQLFAESENAYDDATADGTDEASSANAESTAETKHQGPAQNAVSEQAPDVTAKTDHLQVDTQSNTPASQDVAPDSSKVKKPRQTVGSKAAPSQTSPSSPFAQSSVDAQLNTTIEEASSAQESKSDNSNEKEDAIARAKALLETTEGTLPSSLAQPSLPIDTQSMSTAQGSKSTEEFNLTDADEVAREIAKAKALIESLEGLIPPPDPTPVPSSSVKVRHSSPTRKSGPLGLTTPIQTSTSRAHARASESSSASAFKAAAGRIADDTASSAQSLGQNVFPLAVTTASVATPFTPATHGSVADLSPVVPTISPISPPNQRPAAIQQSSDSDNNNDEATPLSKRHPAERPSHSKRFSHNDAVLEGRVKKKRKKPYNRERAREKADAQMSGSETDEPLPGEKANGTHAKVAARGKKARLLEQARNGPQRHMFMSSAEIEAEKRREKQKKAADRLRVKRLETAVTAMVTRPSMNTSSSPTSSSQIDIFLPAVLGRPPRLLTKELIEAIHVIADWHNYDPDNNLVPKPDDLVKLLESSKTTVDPISTEAQTKPSASCQQASSAAPDLNSTEVEPTKASPPRETTSDNGDTSTKERQTHQSDLIIYRSHKWDVEPQLEDHDKDRQGDTEMVVDGMAEVQLPRTPISQPTPLVEERGGSSWIRRMLGSPLSLLPFPRRDQIPTETNTTNNVPATTQAERYNLDYQPPEAPAAAPWSQYRRTMNGPAVLTKRKSITQKPQDWTHLPQVMTRYGLVDARSSMPSIQGDAVYKSLPVHLWPPKSQRGVLTEEELTMLRNLGQSSQDVKQKNDTVKPDEGKENKNTTETTQPKTREKGGYRYKGAPPDRPSGMYGWFPEDFSSSGDDEETSEEQEQEEEEKKKEKEKEEAEEEGPPRKRPRGTYGYFPEDYSDSDEEGDPAKKEIERKRGLMPSWTEEWIREHDWIPPKYQPKWETENFDPDLVDPVTGARFPNNEQLRTYQSQEDSRTDPYTGRVFLIRQYLIEFQHARKRMDVLTEVYSPNEDSYTHEAPCYYTGQDLNNIFKDGAKGAKPIFFHNLSYLPPLGTYERPDHSDDYDGCFPNEPERLEEPSPSYEDAPHATRILMERVKLNRHPYLGYFRGRGFCENSSELRPEQKELDALMEKKFDESVAWYKATQTPMPPFTLETYKKKEIWESKLARRNQGALETSSYKPVSRPLQPSSAIAKAPQDNIASAQDKSVTEDQTSFAYASAASSTVDHATTQPPPKPTPSHAELPGNPSAQTPVQPSMPKPATTVLDGRAQGPINLFKPKEPSKLSIVWNMSPLQPKEKEEAVDKSAEDDLDKENDMSWLLDPEDLGYELDPSVQTLMSEHEKNHYLPYCEADWPEDLFTRKTDPIEQAAYDAVKKVYPGAKSY